MCCTSSVRRSNPVTSARRQSASSSFLSAIAPLAGPNSRRYAAAVMKCPGSLLTNGDHCSLNEIEACPDGYVCLSETGNGVRGMCCRAAPKCLKRRRPYYIGKKQVVTCGDDVESGCPRGSSCSSSSIEGVDICCLPARGSSLHGVHSSLSAGGHAAGATSEKGRETAPSTSLGTATPSARVPRVVPKCKDGSLPFFALGSRVPQSCTADRDDECPEEYECDAASDEQFYCCPAWDRCPMGSSPFLVEGSRKPLGCNWMANNCPEGYSCEGSKDR